MPDTAQVFGVTAQVNNYSYVDRDNLDQKLIRLLRRQTHIAIKGPSKCGKSWFAHVGIYPLSASAPQGQGFDLGDVSPDNGKAHLLQQPQGSICPQRRCPCPHRVQHNQMVQPVGFFPCGQHGGNGPGVQRSDVDVQPAAQGGDLLRLADIVRHDG